MEYIYAAMLLHKAGKPIDEAGLKKVIEAAGATADDGKLKATVAALTGVDIEETIKNAVIAAPVTAAPAEEKKEAKKEEKKDDKKSEEAAAAGLGSLFG